MSRVACCRGGRGVGGRRECLGTGAASRLVQSGEGPAGRASLGWDWSGGNRPALGHIVSQGDRAFVADLDVRHGVYPLAACEEQKLSSPQG